MALEYKGAAVSASFASCSIRSKPGEGVLQKLRSIRSAKFDGVEMSMPDIVDFAQAQVRKDVSEEDIDALIEASKYIKSFCKDIDLKIMMLQPFARFEGLKSPYREKAFHKAEDWLRIMDALGTTTLQVGSSDAKDISRSVDVLVQDLRELAELCHSNGYRVAYENWCWSTHAPTWKGVWEIVRRVNHPSFGLCLDTFQAAGAEYGDPSTESGYIECISRESLERSWRRSLYELATTVPPEKIFVLQISDAFKMSPPLGREGPPPREQWSQKYRPLPGSGGYLPVQDFVTAVMATGFRGWLSVEVFDMQQEKQESNEDYTTAAMEALKKLVMGN